METENNRRHLKEKQLVGLRHKRMRVGMFRYDNTQQMIYYYYFKEFHKEETNF